MNIEWATRSQSRFKNCAWLVGLSLILSNVSKAGVEEEFFQLLSEEQSCALEPFHRSLIYLNHLQAKAVAEALRAEGDPKGRILKLAEVRKKVAEKRCLETTERIVPEAEYKIEGLDGAQWAGCDLYLEAINDRAEIEAKMIERINRLSLLIDVSMSVCVGHKGQCSQILAEAETLMEDLKGLSERAEAYQNEHDDQARFAVISVFKPDVENSCGTGSCDFTFNPLALYVETFGVIWKKGESGGELPLKVKTSLIQPVFKVTRILTKEKICTEAASFALRGRVMRTSGINVDSWDVVFLGGANVK